jgi:hypothetical protein
MSELSEEAQIVSDLLRQYGRRLANSDVVELAYERGVDLTWNQVDAIRDELREREEKQQ